MNTMLDRFPDGTPVDDWFRDDSVPALEALGTPYVLTAHGILDDGQIHTEQIQALIDMAAAQGGGVIVVPAGVYMTGSLFFRQGVNLYVAEGGMLRGSDDIADYPVVDTRIEGESCRYFAALINAEGLDGFVMAGPGTIDGNGLRSWKAFWLRRSWNPACTNKDEQRPRLVFLSGCRNVTVAGLRLQNAHFWTNHLYRCDHVRYLGCRITSPAAPVKAPSTDAIDIDVCTDVLVRHCFMEVNDDAVVLKGGKGPWADTAPENGANERIIIEDCTYGFCHGCLTLGSESVHDRNVILRRIHVMEGSNLLWLKMRPDTPQHYEHVLIEDVTGRIQYFLNVNPWRQFFDLKGRMDKPVSLAEHVTMRHCDCDCETFFHVTADPAQYRLSDFTFADLTIRAAHGEVDRSAIERFTMERVTINS